MRFNPIFHTLALYATTVASSDPSKLDVLLWQHANCTGDSRKIAIPDRHCFGWNEGVPGFSSFSLPERPAQDRNFTVRVQPELCIVVGKQTVREYSERKCIAVDDILTGG